jgi:hypothetical protein
MPDARVFSDVLEYVSEWDHALMSHTSGKLPRPDLRPEPAMIGRNELGPFCSARLLGGERRSMAVRALPAVVDVIAPRIVTDDDHLSFDIITHETNNRALVIASHGHIIGSHWLAYIDPQSLPGAVLPV